MNLKNQEIQDIFDGDFKHLPRKLDSDKVLHNKVLTLLKISRRKKSCFDSLQFILIKSLLHKKKQKLITNNQQRITQIKFQKFKKHKQSFSIGTKTD